MRHRARTAIVVTCASGLLALPAAPALALSRVAPPAGALYLGTATEDGASAGPVSLRVGADGASVVSLLGGQFHGDLCVETTPLYAGAGSIDPGIVSLGSDGRFSGSQVSGAADGARIAGTLRGRFSVDAVTATATLTYSDAPISGATPCTVTATLTLRRAPATPSGKVTSPRTSTTYRLVTHQGWTSTLVTDHKGATGQLLVSAWDVCHYVDLPSVRFLYPEHLRESVAIKHGRFVAHVDYTGGSGVVVAAVTGQFVGAGHQLAGALHVRRTGSSAGNVFVCDSGRVLFSAR